MSKNKYYLEHREHIIEQAKKRYRANKKAKSDYDRERLLNPKFKKIRNKAVKDWKIRNPEKYKAQTMVSNAIRDGRLFRQPCEICGDKGHAHHYDYSKPFDVIWLCRTHHKERHSIAYGGKK